MTLFKKQLSSIIFHPLALVVIGLLSCSLGWFTVFYAWQNLSKLQDRALYLKQKQQWMLKRQAKEQKLLNQMRNADHDYVEKEIQSLEFLTPEIQKLHSLSLSNPIYAKRLRSLTGAENRLSFKEQNFQHLDHFREVELVQKTPVEMNKEDLEKVLERVETPQKNLNPPNLCVKKLELQKKQDPTGEETFLVQLEILKREITHE